MTEGPRSGICQEWQRGCRDGNLLFPCSSSFQRRLACMDAGGRAASGTKAEESSGLNNPFPQGGNDNPADEMRAGGNRNPLNTPASPPWIPACAGMTKRGLAEIAIRPAPQLQLRLPRRLVPDLPAAGRRRSTTCIHAGVRPCRRERARWKCDFHGSAELAERPVAGRRGNSDSIRVSLKRMMPAFSLAAPAPPRLSMSGGEGLDAGAVQR